MPAKPWPTIKAARMFPRHRDLLDAEVRAELRRLDEAPTTDTTDTTDTTEAPDASIPPKRGI